VISPPMLISFETHQASIKMGAPYLREYWSSGVLERHRETEAAAHLRLHYSNTPVLHYSVFQFWIKYGACFES
jgi:hypothetical protein